MDRHRPDIEAAWKALPEPHKQALLQDRLTLLRYFKALLRERAQISDRAATRQAVRLATDLFGT